MKTSVIIRAYNEAEHIGRLLTGLSRQTLPPEEVILVDSGSTDSTVDIATRFGARIVTITPEEFTFGRSLNLGCGAATGDVLLIASAHVYPLYDTWVEAMLQPFEDPAVALTYGRQVGDHRTRFSEQQLLARWFPTRSNPRQGHPFCNNANAAIRRDLWLTMPYDEEITGLEDMHWAKRAMGAGHHIAYVAEAPVAHVHRETFSQLKNRYRREAIAHASVFPEQRLSRVDAVRIATVNIMNDYLHATLQGKLLPNLLDIPRFRIAQFAGSYQGFQQRGPVAKALLHHFYYPNGFKASRENPDSPTIGEPIQYEELSERHAA